MQLHIKTRSHSNVRYFTQKWLKGTEIPWRTSKLSWLLVSGLSITFFFHCHFLPRFLLAKEALQLDRIGLVQCPKQTENVRREISPSWIDFERPTEDEDGSLLNHRNVATKKGNKKTNSIKVQKGNEKSQWDFRFQTDVYQGEFYSTSTSMMMWRKRFPIQSLLNISIALVIET